MEISKLGLFIFGVAFLLFGIFDLLVGETNGFSAGNMSSMSITYEKHPIEFTLSIIFKIVIGGLSIRKAFQVKGNDE